MPLPKRALRGWSGGASVIAPDLTAADPWELDGLQDGPSAGCVSSSQTVRSRSMTRGHKMIHDAARCSEPRASDA